MFALNAYNRTLKSKPLLVTAISTAVCYGAGDTIAQSIEIKQNKREEYDLSRLGVFVTFGLLAGGPVYYAWFSKIDKMPMLIEKLVKWNEQRALGAHFRKELKHHMNSGSIETMSMKTFRSSYNYHFENIEKPLIRSKTVLVAKIYADQFIFSVLYPIFFMGTTGVMLDATKYDLSKPIGTQFVNSCSKAWTNIKDKFLQIYVADCAVWPLAQMANFAFVPSHLQPIFVNFLNIGWNTFLSYVSQDSHSGSQSTSNTHN
jgi:hypothetical protein